MKLRFGGLPAFGKSAEFKLVLGCRKRALLAK
ncbi:MAG: hypothetical protein ACI8X5_000590 [Planctomycetota bacterium]|jgi:hypothetical protein